MKSVVFYFIGHCRCASTLGGGPVEKLPQLKVGAGALRVEGLLDGRTEGGAGK